MEMSTYAIRSQQARQKRLTSPGQSLVPAPSRFEIDLEELIHSIEISEDEILADLLYPEDHRAVRSGGGEPRRFEPR
jgi:hypothetical protein